MSKATNKAATKRNNRKIHARKFLATPEGKAWLAKKQEEREEIKLARGNFDLRRKNQRPGRNPKTGEEIPISARTVVTFRPGQKLKERVEAYAGSGQ